MGCLPSLAQDNGDERWMRPKLRLNPPPSCEIAICVRLSLLNSLKVDISALHIRANQFHTELLADVHALKTARQSSFNG